MSEIAAWLNTLGLGQYANVFIENEIDFDIIAQLGEQGLKDLGLSLGARKRLLNAIGGLDNKTTPAGEARSATGAASPAPQAERRQLTVMFIDLVGSTALSERLDPEDLSAIMRRLGPRFPMD